MPHCHCGMRIWVCGACRGGSRAVGPSSGGRDAIRLLWKFVSQDVGSNWKRACCGWFACNRRRHWWCCACNSQINVTSPCALHWHAASFVLSWQGCDTRAGSELRGGCGESGVFSLQGLASGALWSFSWQVVVNVCGVFCPRQDFLSLSGRRRRQLRLLHWRRQRAFGHRVQRST